MVTRLYFQKCINNLVHMELSIIVAIHHINFLRVMSFIRTWQL